MYECMYVCVCVRKEKRTEIMLRRDNKEKVAKSEVCSAGDYREDNPTVIRYR